MIGELNQEQKDILLGLMLGDGNFDPSGHGSSRLQIKQSVGKKEYVEWLYRRFANLTRTPPKQRMDTDQWYFGTRYTRTFQVWRDEYYDQDTKKKMLPKTLEEAFVSPLSLAVWYMDDGSMDYREKSHHTYTFSVDCFTLQEVERLQVILWNRFGIETSIQHPRSREKRYYKLYIGSAGRDRFINIVYPFVLDCFSYKLHPDYLTPQRLNQRMLVR